MITFDAPDLLVSAGIIIAVVVLAAMMVRDEMSRRGR